MAGPTMILCGFVLAAFAIGSSNAVCPPVPCTLMFIPEPFRASSYVVHGGQLCKRCDMWIEPTDPTDEMGCPLRPCPMVHLPPGCAADMLTKYFLWKGQMCKDCPEIHCNGEIVH